MNKAGPQGNMASPQAKNQQQQPAAKEKEQPNKKGAAGAGKGHEDPKLSGKNQPPVKQQPPPPEKKKAPYELINVDTNEFYQRYNKFLEEDKENKKKQAEYLKTYLENTGLKMAFRVIAAEAISKNMRPDEVLAYAADRLKELGKEIEKISVNTATSNNLAAANAQTKTGASTTSIPANTNTKSSTNVAKK